MDGVSYDSDVLAGIQKNIMEVFGDKRKRMLIYEFMLALKSVCLIYFIFL